MPRNPRSIWPNTRLVPALLDRSMRVNETALQEAVSHGVAVPVARWLNFINVARRKSGEKELTPKDVRDHYFIPMHDPTAQKASVEMAKKREPGVWGRSEYYQTPGKAFIYKGIGTQPERFIDGYKDRLVVYHNPFENLAERAFQGGRYKSTVKFVDTWQEKLREEYRKALEERDPVALEAQRVGIHDLPIPDAVAAFKPLEMPAGTQNQKRHRIISNYQFLPRKIQKNWRVELYTAPHPHRFLEYDGMPHDKVNLQAVLEASGISTREGKLYLEEQEITQEKAVDVLAERHTVLSALLIHLLDHRLNHSFTDVDKKRVNGSIFSLHNTGPAAFFDLDTIVPKTAETYGFDFDNGKDMIEQGMHNLVLTAYLGETQTPFFHREKYLQQYDDLLKTGRQYIERKGKPAKKSAWRIKLQKPRRLS